MFVLNLPIEPMPTRYSIEWDKWFREAFARNNIGFATIPGHEFVNGIKNDQFLNPINSFKWKFSQLESAMNILQYRKEQVVIFLQDAWFPGVEAFCYIRDLTKGSFYHKICGFLHGGSYLPKDITAGKQWAKHAENSFLGCMNKVFVGSHYHKDALCEAHGFFPDCTIVTGCPVSTPGMMACQRENIVVWPHRISADKRPDLFDKLASDLRKSHPDTHFVKSLEVCKTKMEYYNLLGMAKVAVSTAEHETFGISMVEAAMSGCYPVCPNRLSYPEIGDQYLYDNYEELVTQVEECLEAKASYHYPKVNHWHPIIVTDKICKEIKGMFDE